MPNTLYQVFFQTRAMFVSIVPLHIIIQHSLCIKRSRYSLYAVDCSSVCRL